MYLFYILYLYDSIQKIRLICSSDYRYVPFLGHEHVMLQPTQVHLVFIYICESRVMLFMYICDMYLILVMLLEYIRLLDCYNHDVRCNTCIC